MKDKRKEIKYGYVNTGKVYNTEWNKVEIISQRKGRYFYDGEDIDCIWYLVKLLDGKLKETHTLYEL